MPDQQDGRAVLLGEAHQLVGAGPHLHHRAGGPLQRVRPQRLDGVDHHQIGLEQLQPVEDLAQVRLCGEFHRRVCEPEPAGAILHLGLRFFARHVGDPRAAARQPGRCLQQQGGFADARIPADQQRRGRHHAAAAHPIQFADAGSQPGLGRGFCAEALEGELFAGLEAGLDRRQS